jgi:hypothetical protein
MKATELAWAAGLFDGEGSTSIEHRSGWYSIRLSVKQASDNDAIPFVLIRFLNAVGKGKIYGPYFPKNPNWKPTYIWHSGAVKDVDEVIKKISRFLSPVKLEQIERVRKEVNRRNND